MTLEARLPELFDYPPDACMPPISAAKVIAGARRRRIRGRLVAATTALVLAAGAGVLADRLPAQTATGRLAALSPVRVVALEEHLVLANNAQMWLSSVEACVEEPIESGYGWTWDPIGINASVNCAQYHRQGLNGNASPSFGEAMGLGEHPGSSTMPFMGVYVGPQPAAIVISADGETTVATLVTSPDLHDEFGYYAEIHYPLPPSGMAPVGTDGAFQLLPGGSITETAYNITGHILATITWKGGATTPPATRP